ncbi:hypothetical protein C8R44DRAFT_732773 [Mycena epipterygia]|nr:hypothetical protein C8R44DRAFT_732773 [Mycena epipterygia]
MFGAIPLQSSDSRIILQQLLQFKKDQTIFDAGFRPPAFRRDFPSQFEPSKAIPITLKRKKNEKADGEQPNQRAKQTKKEAAARKKKSSSPPHRSATSLEGVGQFYTATVGGSCRVVDSNIPYFSNSSCACNWMDEVRNTAGSS